MYDIRHCLIENERIAHLNLIPFACDRCFVSARTESFVRPRAELFELKKISNHALKSDYLTPNIATTNHFDVALLITNADGERDIMCKVPTTASSDLQLSPSVS